MVAVAFAYDAQIRRFVVQFIRLVSNFQVEFGRDDTGTKTLKTVPVYYGDVSRQAAMILKNNSENTLNAVPAMATYISSLTYDRDRVQNPYHEGVVRLRQQTFDPVTQSYTGKEDGVYTVDRLMPAPYKLTLKLDIWTSNTEQKHQIIEQIAPVFNPALEIQNSDNYVDWTSLSAVFLTDVNYTSRTVPAGADDSSIDIATMTFEIPIWLTLPAKVKKNGVTATMVRNLFTNDTTSFTTVQNKGDLGTTTTTVTKVEGPVTTPVPIPGQVSTNTDPETGKVTTTITEVKVDTRPTNSQNTFTVVNPLAPDVIQTLQGLTTRQRFTPMNYQVQYIGNSLKLYKLSQVTINGVVAGTPANWEALVATYGKLKNGISEVRLAFQHEAGNYEIIGTVAYNPADSSTLLYTTMPETLPTNTLPAVNAIIDPRKVSVDQAPYSGTTQSLLNPTAGTRYLILNAIGDEDSVAAQAWKGKDGSNLVAGANDIIQWNGVRWTISFDHRNKTVQYVSNLNTTIQYIWTGEHWIKSVEGLYRSGEWSLVL